MILKKLLVRLFIIPIRHIKYIYYLIIISLVKNYFPKLNILDSEKTIEAIIDKKLSISRFGDGEFNWIIGNKFSSFQDSSKELSKDLQRVLTSSNEKILICIPSVLNGVTEINLNAKHFWTSTLFRQRFHVFNLLNYGQIYGDSLFTRPYMIFNNKTNSKKYFEKAKLIWNKRDLVIVEGDKTFFGINNDLLDNANSIIRIVVPNVNAYHSYHKILNECLKFDKKPLFLLAVGPTATILAYDLAQNGYQAIDIGHLDIEYEWFKLGAKKKVSIPGKYVNEIKNKFDNSSLLHNDRNYIEQVKVKIL